MKVLAIAIALSVLSVVALRWPARAAEPDERELTRRIEKRVDERLRVHFAQSLVRETPPDPTH